MSGLKKFSKDLLCRSKTNEKDKQATSDFDQQPHGVNPVPNIQKSEEIEKSNGIFSNAMSNVKQKFSRSKKSEEIRPPRPEPQPASQSFNSDSTRTSWSSSSSPRPISVLNPFRDWQDPPEPLWSSLECREWIVLCCCQKLGIPEDEAIYVASGYIGSGRDLYNLTEEFWTRIIGNRHAGLDMYEHLQTLKNGRK